MATVDGKGHASGLPPLGISRSDRKRTAELLFGAKVAKSMGLFHAKIEAENFAEEKEPTVKMSKSRKVEVVGRAIRSITTQCASMGCPNAVEMFDWSEFEYVHTKESMLAALTGPRPTNAEAPATSQSPLSPREVSPTAEPVGA